MSKIEFDIYYVVKQYEPSGESYSKLEKPLYEAGPFSTYDDASYYIAGQWLYTEDFFIIVRQSIVGE